MSNRRLRSNKASASRGLGAFLACGLFVASGSPLALAATDQDLDAAFSKGQWNDTAEIAHELLRKNPKAPLPKLKGAYALFQKGYSNSALVLLRGLSPSDWKLLPQGQNRLVEIVSLFQKKVPLNLLPARLEQMNVDMASPYFSNEIHFAKGREALERADYATARKYLQLVSKGSRYFGQAHYLLATIAVRQKSYKAAQTELSAIFEPEVFEQSAEFWNDLGSQLTNHWGSNLKVMMDSELISKVSSVGELAVIGMARISYALKDHESALHTYEKIASDSRLYPRATLEKVWTLLALNRHDDAQKAASLLTVNDGMFEAAEARTVRALVLTDAGRTSDARAELDAFFEVYQRTRAAIEEYRGNLIAEALPLFLRNDLKDDRRMEALRDYREKLKAEMDALQAEDIRLFPVYAALPGELTDLLTQSRNLLDKMTRQHVTRRLADLDRLYTQSRLIMAETYLEDRERLRTEFKSLGPQDEGKQAEHEQQLRDLLAKAISEVDLAMKKTPARQLNLEFRQGELLWELGTIESILGQEKKDAKVNEAALRHKKQALKIIEEIAANYPKFAKHAQAMFFSGYAEMELGSQAEAVRRLERFATLYPRHPHVPDAYRILADIKFDSNRFVEAEADYRKILGFADSPIVGYALYKIGWCAYNRKDYARALFALEKAIVWANNRAQVTQLLTFKKESRHDLISIYAEVGDHRKAVDYFKQFAGGEVAGWVLDLSKQLDSIGQYEKSGDLYRTLSLMDPSSPDNMAYQASIAYGAYRLHRWPKVLEAVRELIGRYGDQLRKPRSGKENSAFVEKTLREVVLAQQFEFKKSDREEDVGRVLELDKLYFSAFEKWPESQAPLYQHAQFLFQKGKSADAVSAFEKHWTQFKADLKEPLREEALRSLIGALGKGERIDELLELTQEYSSSYPKSKYARAIAFLHSSILLKANRLKEGIAESQALFDSNMTDDIGQKAFKNMSAAYYQLKDWKATNDWANELISRKEKGIQKFSKELQTVREESLFLYAEGTEDHARAAELFLRIANDPTMKRLHDKSNYNAFVRLHKAESRYEAVQVAERMEKANPEFEGLRQIAGLRAALHQDAGDYVRALPLLLGFLARPDKSVSPDTIQQARLNAALIAEALDRDADAVKLYGEYLSNAADEKSAGAAESRRGLARIKEKRKADAGPVSRKWAQLSRERSDFERAPLAQAGDLVPRIQQGGQRLERLVKQFVDLSSSNETPAYQAFEAYCSIPLLYSAFGQAVRNAGKASSDREVENELEKVAAPIDAKSTEMAEICLSKSAEAGHDGPLYRRVNEKYGWEKDKEQSAKVSRIVQLLKEGFPWLDPADDKWKSEEEVIETHLKKRGTEDSWYRLARLRWEKKPGLSRLTLIDALNKTPKSGKLMNALACAEMLRSGESWSGQDFATLLSEAGKSGSVHAWANLAYYHLKGGRLEPGLDALKRAWKGDVLDNNVELERLARETLKK